MSVLYISYRYIKSHIMIGFFRWKHKVRLFITFSDSLCCIAYFVFIKDGSKMVFQTLSGSAFSPIQYPVYHNNKIIYRRKSPCNNLTISCMFYCTEECVFLICPPQENGIRIFDRKHWHFVHQN